MNLFSSTSLIIFVASIAFGLFVYSTDIKSKINQRWLLFSGLISAWSLGLYGVTSANSVGEAINWQYLLDVSAIFMPVVYFSFASELVSVKNYYWRYLSYFFAFVISIFSFTSYFKLGVIPKYGFYWIQPGSLYIIFPAFFVLYIIACLFIYIKGYINNKDVVFRSQIRNIFLASLIGFGGGITNFMPQTVNVYPFGNYLILLYLFFMSYGVLKYKLLTARMVSTQLFAGATVLIFLFNFFQATDFNDAIIKLLLLILGILFSILLVRSVDKEIKAREKIEKLATDLETANVRLTELDRQKSEFVSFATHQLRAPLTAMKGYASMILEGDMGTLSDEAKLGVSRIFDSAKTLTSIVDDYLNITRIELGSMKYVFDVIDFKTLIDDIIAELKPNIEKSGLNFTFTAENGDVDYRITADRDKFKQVIANLIDNSMKYTPKGSVALSLRFDRALHKVIFTIKDTGIGIDPEVLPHLFLKWSRAGNANKTNIKGTGLGLFVAKEIITAHHGTIRAESPGEGKGSTFIVEIEPWGKM